MEPRLSPYKGEGGMRAAYDRKSVGSSLLDGGAPLATRGLCASRGVWCSYRPKFEIGIVDLLARKKELATAPGTTNTRPLGGRTEIPEFGVPSKSRTSRFRAVKNMPASLVHTETKMNTHKHFEAGIELHSLSIVRYNRNINGMRPKFKESNFCPLNPPHADRLVHTSHTPPSSRYECCI